MSLEALSVSIQTEISTKESIQHINSDYIFINNVKITPPELNFEDAYEGKQYKRKLTIQNCGKHLVIIKIGEPTARVFILQPISRGIVLAPGMKLTRYVKYKYARAIDIQNGFTIISINNEEFKFHFTVTLAKAILQIEPEFINFGSIDAVNHATSKQFKIENLGSRTTQFCIDLGTNPLEMTVEPRRGIVPAKGSATITVEIVSSQEGEFTEEFWVKTDPPKRIVVTGKFISPKLLVRKFINSLDFTLIEFPPTYYGSESPQSLLIRNFSSSNSMFCVMAEVKGAIMDLKNACDVDDNYKNFIVKRIDGRMAAQRGVLIEMLFAPVITSRRKDPNYAACFLKIFRMDCRDLMDSDILAVVPPVQDVHSMTSHGETESRAISLSKQSFTNLAVPEEPQHEEVFSFEHAIGVCLHGEKETAGIALRPTFLTLKELTLNKSYNREVHITNKSKNLPIQVKYNKIAGIDVNPKMFHLKPTASLEVLISIKTTKLENIQRKITFDLLDTCGRLVGKTNMKLVLETTQVEKIKITDHCKICNDLDLKLESEFPYRLRIDQLEKKQANDQFYLDYIRSLSKPNLNPEKVLSQIDLTGGNLAKMSGQCRKFTLKITQEKSLHAYLPLAPRQLFNIKIRPKSITLQKIAPFTTITDFIMIENLNPFPIFALLTASKSYLIFDNNSRHHIRANEKRKVYFTFNSQKIGRYYVNINVLINSSVVFEVTAVAHVVPKILKLDTDELVFTEADDDYKFVKVVNTLNTYTAFSWEVPDGCFDIIPREGGIRAESFLFCMVKYTPDSNHLNTAELNLIAESGHKNVLFVSYKKRPHIVAFDSYSFDVGMIPLNVPIQKKIVMKNLKKNQVLYSVQNCVPIPGITVTPQDGILKCLESQVFTITILLKSVIEFSTEIFFMIEDTEEISVSLKGFVEYPRLILKPPLLYFRKISPYSYDTQVIKIINYSKLETSVAFCEEEFSDFAITKSENFDDENLKQIVLQPEESKVLYLHFQPKHITTCSFFLPYVIQGILGPVYINSSGTNQSQYFLKSNNQIYDNAPNVNLLQIPRMLPTVRINCLAVEKSLEISSLKLEFWYFGNDHVDNVTSSEFEITNVSSETAAICIRIDDVGPPFFVNVKSESNVEFYPVSYKIILEPEETITLEAQFFPQIEGKYVIKLPIFLRNYYDDKIFNFVILKGIYGTPQIIPSTDTINFEAVPLRLTSELVITLRMLNHFNDCKIWLDSDLTTLYGSFEKIKNDKNEIFQQVTLAYDSSYPSSFDSYVSFCCSCNSTCMVKITGVIESCILSDHAYYHFIKKELMPLDDKFKDGMITFFKTSHLLVNKNRRSFPLFPSDEDTSWYGKYMRNLQKALENWMFSQVFYMQAYYRIPEDFTNFYKNDKPMRKATFGGFLVAKPADLPLLKLMENIAGTKVRNEIAPRCPKEHDDNSWLSYVYNSYSNTLHYLRKFPIHVPHITSKYLLNYEQYCHYEKYNHPEITPMEESKFYRLSKQCWIDLILQINKVFFLCRSVEFPKIEDDDSESRFRNKLCHSFSTMSRSSVEELETLNITEMYGRQELELILWLEECYEKEKNNIWGEKATNKQIVLIDEALKDGVILGAVTAYYCPYIRSEIQNNYPNPNTIEETFHNICNLVKIWKSLKFSYIINPLSFQDIGVVEMLLLVNYLYNVLPGYQPREEVRIEAPLTQTNIASIDLENLGTNPIYYQVILFGEDSHFFSTAHNSVNVKPKSKKTIKVCYHAKTVKNKLTTVVFSGETPGHKFGKSIVVTLVGVADVSFACMTIPLNVEMYKLCEFVIEAQSPFKVAANYSISCGFDHMSIEDNCLYPVDELKSLKIIKEFVIQDSSALFDDHGKCVTKQQLCCLEKGPRDMWVYFTNPDVGDWGIQLTLTGKITNACYEEINIELPETYSNLNCRCKAKPSVKANCPLLIHLTLPMKNNLLWNARKSMILNNVEGDEYDFWSRRIFTPTGTRILKLLLNSETHPLKQTIIERVRYKINLDRPPAFVTLRNIVIEDVTSEDSYTLPIHPITDLTKFDAIHLRLISEDGRETRFYKLKFVMLTDDEEIPE